MAQWKLKSKKYPSGKLRHASRKKRKMDRGRDFTPTTIGKTKIKKIRTVGGNSKRIAFSVEFANLFSNGKTQKVKIKSVLENPANMQYVRRNIITKGSIIETDAGNALVTSRPGQNGIVNAVAVK